MPRHLELIESCASCLPHGNSVSSVACDLLYKTTNLFLPYPSDGDRWFSLTLWFKYACKMIARGKDIKHLLAWLTWTHSSPLPIFVGGGMF